MSDINIRTAYETLEYLATKSAVFAQIRDEVKFKNQKIEELEGMIMELTMALAIVAGGEA